MYTLQNMSFMYKLDTRTLMLSCVQLLAVINSDSNRCNWMATECENCWGVQKNWDADEQQIFNLIVDDYTITVE
jgi:hypothetical protein